MGDYFLFLESILFKQNSYDYDLTELYKLEGIMEKQIGIRNSLEFKNINLLLK